MRSARLVAGAVASTLVASCVHGGARLPHQEGHTGFPRLPTELAFTKTAASGTAEVAASGTMTLAEAFKLALANSERVSIASQNVTAAEILYAGSVSDVRPTINMQAYGTFQREQKLQNPDGSESTFVPPIATFVGATLLQPMFRRGFFAAREAFDRRKESASAALEREREQLSRDVIVVFIGTLRARKLLDLAKAAVARAKTQYDFAGARVKAGQSLKNAELLALVDLTRAQRQEVAVQRELDNLGALFLRLVGRPPAAQLELPPLPVAPDSKAAVKLAATRMDIQALEQRVDETEAQIDAAQGKRYWPTLDLVAGIQVQKQFPQVFNQVVTWQVSGVLNIPILQNGRETTDVRLRQNDRRIAQLAVEQQRKVVTEEAQRAALQMESALKASELAEQQVAAARDHYKLVDKQVRLGAITFLEVTNAQAILVEAENAFEIANMERVLALYDYLFVIGALDLDGSAKKK